jgi:2-C-methyl-D-erythritol 4-phosphate cytidylyltransferase
MNKLSVIIPAGGVGKRFGGTKPKQFHEIDGKAIIIRTLNCFIEAGINNIIVSINHLWREYFEQLIKNAEIEHHIRIVEGGKERQNSIENALELLDSTTELVLVHDAVRPFISKELINNIISSAKKHGAVIPALPLRETIKQIDENGFVVRTHDRDSMVSVQTPQGFKYSILIDSYRKARKNGCFGTDDASLVEKAGYPVKVIEGEIANIKITIRGDVE